MDGLITGSATITASSGGCAACSGSTTVTVVLTGVTSIVVNPSSASATVNVSTAYFTAKAQPGSVDITSSGAVWTVQDSTGTDQTANFSIGFVAGQGEGFEPLSGATAPSYTIVVTYPGTTIVGKATLNVTQ